ncbi:MAG: hypothetical protein Kow0097_11710 [Candidatus Bipolaricaulota bacterium]|nr:hypothetical protein [Candidatus Bipolaricaulota bacterium]
MTRCLERAGALGGRFRRTGPARRAGLGLLLLGLAGLSGAALATHTIRVEVEPARAGTVFGAGTYEEGGPVLLSALPDRGFEFTGWFEDGVELSTSPALELSADRDRTLVARFRPTLGFAGIAGSGKGELTLLPSPELRSSRLEVRPRLRFGPDAWDLRLVAAFAEDGWRDAQLHFSGAWQGLRFGTGLFFDPQGPLYRSGYAMASGRWDDLRWGLRVTHYPLSGTPPAPYLLYALTLSTSAVSVSLRGEERDGFRFKDVLVRLPGFDLCCGLRPHATLSVTKEGFAYLRAGLTGLPSPCPGLSLDVAITFSVDQKALEVSPRWSPYCDACVTVHGDALWDSESSRWEGLALYGYKIRCCFPDASIEFVTAFDPSRVPGGFQGDEFEYVKVNVCGSACCGETYSFDAIAFFSPTGLFGLSRVKTTLSVPLLPSFVLTPTLEVEAGGAALSVGWELRF